MDFGLRVVTGRGLLSDDEVLITEADSGFPVAAGSGRFGGDNEVPDGSD